MYDRILFPTDGSEGAQAVFDHVLEFTENHGATLHILNVADTTHESVTRIGRDVVDVLEREGEEIVEAAAERATDWEISTVTAVHQGRVPETITAYADEHGIDLIAMPTHGRTGLERVLLGSVTERVIRQAPVPVFTLRPDEEPSQYPYRNVLVPTDGSECATTALSSAVDIVKASRATLHVLSVVDVTSLGVDVRSEFQTTALEEKANQVVEEATEAAESASVDSIVDNVVFGDSIYRAIDSYIEEHDVDLVVIGTHGRTGINRYLLGSVTEKTVRRAAVPVLTVPEPQTDASNT